MTIAQLHRSTAHPPCPQEIDVLEIPVPVDRSELALTDRLSLRIGLWLLLRARRARRRSAAAPIDVPSHFPGAPLLSQREALAILTNDLQRQLR
ncbi:hypothetical protein ACWGJP_12565 [Microbacterium sp. NPDC055903]